MIFETPPTRNVTLSFSLDEAEAFRDGLSDILCWIRGFVAACPDDHDRHPIGQSVCRDLNTKIKKAIDIYINGDRAL